MKKLCAILAAVFLLSVFQPCQALESEFLSDNGTNGYIVKLKQSTENTVYLMDDIKLHEVYGEAGLYTAETISDIKALGDLVEYYEPDYTVTLAELPNDPYASKQWSLGNLDASYAWEKGYDGKGVKIAVIDSGVNSMHEDFEGTNFAGGKNVMNGSHDVTDESGHGTFVCGILGAARNNSLGVAGLFTEVTIIPIKCFGKSRETDASFVVSAIYEAVDTYDCDVINLSLGMDDSMESMKSAVEYAADKGVIIVSSVGNYGTTQMMYPAAYDCVIGVGAVDQNGVLASFSQRNQSVFVVAPGVKICSLDFKAITTYCEGNGTSYSTPFVSAAAVMLKQFAPAADVEDFAALIKATAIDAGEIGYDYSYGYGRLNIKNFVTAMEDFTILGVGTVFADAEGHWAEKSIQDCVIKKLFTGVTACSFEPEMIMNRAMFVTVLSRMSGENINGYTNSFSDVPNDSWYVQSSAWGASTGLVAGMGGGAFNPMGAVSREQMAVFLYRYAKQKGLTDGTVDQSLLNNFSDKGKISPWATEAMAWAVNKGLISGRSANCLCPTDSAKRCEVATIISRFATTFGI